MNTTILNLYVSDFESKPDLELGLIQLIVRTSKTEAKRLYEELGKYLKEE